MINKRIFKFIICSILSIIVEYFFLYSFLKVIFKLSNFTCLIIIASIFVFCFILMFIAIFSLNLTKEETEEHNEEVDKLIDDFNFENNINVHTIYLESSQPNSAWSVNKTIFINNNYPINKEFLLSVVAHELGHIKSGISSYTSLSSLKPSTFISRIIYLIMVIFINKNNKVFKVLAYFLFGLYFLFSLNNIIFIYRFLINDEYIANSYAVKKGYGMALRCYYGIALDISEDNIMRKSDFLHPSVTSMINRINDELGLYSLNNKYNLDFYYVNNTLYRCTLKTKTVKLPDFIEYISTDKYNVFHKDVVKISGKNLKQLKYINVYGLKKLTELNIPNCVDIDMSIFKYLKQLKLLKVNNELASKLLNTEIIDLNCLKLIIK